MLVYEVVCTCGFEFLRTFLRICAMFLNEKVCEIVLIISDSTEYDFSASIFIELSKFWCEVFTAIMGWMLVHVDRRENGKRLVA